MRIWFIHVWFPSKNVNHQHFGVKSFIFQHSFTFQQISSRLRCSSRHCLSSGIQGKAPIMPWKAPEERHITISTLTSFEILGSSIEFDDLMEKQKLGNWAQKHRKVICVPNVQQMSQKINPYWKCSFWKCYLHLPTKSMIKPPGQGLWKKKQLRPHPYPFIRWKPKPCHLQSEKHRYASLKSDFPFHPRLRSPFWGKVMRPRYTSKKSTKATNVHKWHTMMLSGSLTLRPWK